MNMIKFAEAQGYTHEQAIVIDLMDDTFTVAVEAGLLTGEQVEALGRSIGKLMADNNGIKTY